MNNTMEKKNVNDGYYKLEYKEDGVYITVYPSIGSGQKVTISEVVNRLARKKIKNYSRMIVEDSIKRPTKLPVKIAEFHEEELLDAQVDIHVSADKMKAYMTVIAPDGGTEITMEKVKQALEENSVCYGINEELLDAVVKYPEYGEKVLIAQGKPPINGKSGSVEFHVEIKKERKPTILEDGRVDYRELNIIKNIKAGEKLCSLIPPLSGTPGKNVIGIEVSCLNGKPARLPKGRNVETDEFEESLYASIDGEIDYIDGKLSILQNYEVPADVGTSTGNINFIGNVLIRGNVVSGYVVEAGGSVEVFGVVEGAIIKAQGDIVLRRGMQGLGKGQLICRGDVIARYIENSHVVAGRDVKAEAIMHSTINCGNAIEVSGRKGLIVGGSCRVAKEVIAKVVGSHMATTTDIDVGIDPSIKERYKNNKFKLRQQTEDFKKAEQAVVILQKLKKAQKLNPQKEQLLAKSIRTIAHLSNKIKELKEEIENIEKKLQEDAKGKVHVSSYIYQGTKITMGTAMLYVKDTLQHCTLYRDGVDIRVGIYEK